MRVPTEILVSQQSSPVSVCIAYSPSATNYSKSSVTVQNRGLVKTSVFQRVVGFEVMYCSSVTETDSRFG